MTTIATRRQLSGTTAVAALVLVVWIPLVADYVEGAAVTDLFWQGLDLVEFLALALSAVLAWRRSPYAAVTAGLAAVLLLSDATIDVLLATETDLLRAIAMAVFAEVPLAVLCLDLTRQSARRYPQGRALLAPWGEPVTASRAS